jgi:hypothetical protein
MFLYIPFMHGVLSGASALHAWCILFPSLLQQHISALNSVPTLQEAIAGLTSQNPVNSEPDTHLELIRPLDLKEFKLFLLNF